MKHSLAKALCLFLLPVMIFSGCGQEELPEEELFPLETDVQEFPDRTILPELFSLPYAPELTLDPITCADGMQQLVSSLVCEGLFRLGPDFEPIPWLCEAYTYDAETFTYVMTLRNVRFSDGTPLTGTDVKTALNRARTSERYASRLAQIASVSADEGSVTVTLTSSNTAFPTLLDFPIPKAGTESFPVGTGPYLLSLENSTAWLIANQSWWQESEQPANRIALVEAGDQDTMLYRFTSHDVQVITADLTGITPISATGSIAYQDADTTILQFLGCNVNREPLNDAAFRRLLFQGIDRSYLVSAFLSGHGIPAQFPVSPRSPLYPADLEQPYSPAEFTAALGESGLSAGRTLTLLVNEENSFKVSAAQQVAETFSGYGIPMIVRTLPWAEYTAALAAGEFDLYYGEIKLTADWDLSHILGTDAALNYGGWADPLFDQYLSAYRSAANRSAAMERICSYLRNQAPIMPICFKSTSVLLQTDVLEGLSPTMNEPFYNLADCTIHLAEN